MTILILGGAGTIAEITERDLLASGVDRFIIADRDQTRLDARKRLLGAKKIETAVMDITAKDFAKQLKATGASVIINSTWYKLNTTVMRAAIQAGLHYLDLGGLYHMTREQLTLKNEAEKAGVTCLLGMGETPGTMNVLARHAGEFLDTIDTVQLRCGARTLEGDEGEFSFPYAVQTILDEVTAPPVVFAKGKLQDIKPLSGKHEYGFPEPVGAMTCYPALHSELASLPAYFKRKGVKTMDFAYAYDPELLEVITALHKIKLTSKETIAVKGVTLSPYDFLAEWDKQKLASPGGGADPKDIEALSADLHGTYKGEKRRVRADLLAHWHSKWKKSAGTVATGVPPSIAAQWLADGTVDEPGVWAPEDIIEPLPFFKELNRHGRDMQVFLQIDDDERKRLN